MKWNLEVFVCGNYFLFFRRCLVRTVRVNITADLMFAMLVGTLSQHRLPTHASCFTQNPDDPARFRVEVSFSPGVVKHALLEGEHLHAAPLVPLHKDLTCAQVEATLDAAIGESWPVVHIAFHGVSLGLFGVSGNRRDNG